MKYSEEMKETLAKLIKKGSTVTSACNSVGINKTTFYDWMKNKVDFSNAVKEAQSVANAKIENALFKTAHGYTVTEKEYRSMQMRGFETEKKLVKTTKKKVLPNVTAQIFWLKNRNSEEWRDRQDIEHSGEVGVKYEISDKFMPKTKKSNGKKEQ
jgi:transposase-like protein